MDVLVGIGLDLIDLEQFRRHYGTLDPELLARCFTDGEVDDAGNGVDRLERLAARFAAKEATIKALGGGEGVGWPDIETVKGEGGAPKIILHREARRISDARGVTRFLVSLTHSAASAGAVVVAISDHGHSTGTSPRLPPTSLSGHCEPKEDQANRLPREGRNAAASQRLRAPARDDGLRQDRSR